MEPGWRTRKVEDVVGVLRDALEPIKQSDCTLDVPMYLPPIVASQDADRWLTFAIGLWASCLGTEGKLRVHARYEDRSMPAQGAVALMFRAEGCAPAATAMTAELLSKLEMLVEELLVRGIAMSIRASSGVPGLEFRFRVQPGSERPALHRNAILLVEDDMLVRMACHAVLESAGYRVIECGTLKEAFRFSEQLSSSLRMLIADITLPDGDGHALASLVRAQRSTVPVLLTSGYTQTALESDHSLHFLAKPFDRESLLEAVRKCLVTSHSVSAGISSIQLRGDVVPGTCA